MMKISAETRILYFRLLKYVQPYWKIFVVSLVATALTAATEPMFPALMKPMLDGKLGAADQLAWIRYPAIIIGIVLLRSVFDFVAGYAMHWVTNRVTADIRKAMFAKMVLLPCTYFENSQIARVVSRITNDVNGLTAAATTVLTGLVKDFLTLLALLSWMIYLNWQLTLLIGVILPLVQIAVRYFSGRVRKFSRQLLDSFGDFSQVIQEVAEGHKVVKLHCAEQSELARFSRSIEQFRGFNMRLAIAGELLSPLIHLIFATSLAIVVGLAMYQASEDVTSVGSFVSFVTAMLMLLAPAKRLAGLNVPLQRGMASAESVFAFLDEANESGRTDASTWRCQGRVDIEGVCFAYPGAERNALSHISLRIAPGEMVAVVGPSGGGKSTLLGLLTRFHDADSGNILIDGKEVHDLSLPELRSQFSLVSQDVFLFNDTVAANIAYGQKAAVSESDLREAARAAYALDFIEALPEGFATEIGDRGVRLSGGQRQRLAIARAILKNAPILLLDEATSALDSESEQYVQAAIESLMGRSTTIVIAHRLSTVRRADRIVVMLGGKIVEEGTHAELLAKNGEYRKLYQLQFQGSEADDGAGA